MAVALDVEELLIMLSLSCPEEEEEKKGGGEEYASQFLVRYEFQKVYTFWALFDINLDRNLEFNRYNKLLKCELMLQPAYFASKLIARG